MGYPWHAEGSKLSLLLLCCCLPGFHGRGSRGVTATAEGWEVACGCRAHFELQASPHCSIEHVLSDGDGAFNASDSNLV